MGRGAKKSAGEALLLAIFDRAAEDQRIKGQPRGRRVGEARKVREVREIGQSSMSLSSLYPRALELEKRSARDDATLRCAGVQECRALPECGVCGSADVGCAGTGFAGKQAPHGTDGWKVEMTAAIAAGRRRRRRRTRWMMQESYAHSSAVPPSSFRQP